MGVRVGWFRTIKEVGWNTTPLEKVVVAKMVIDASEIITPIGMLATEESSEGPLHIGGGIYRTDFLTRIILTVSYNRPDIAEVEAINGTDNAEVYYEGEESNPEDYAGEDHYYTDYLVDLKNDESLPYSTPYSTTLLNGFSNGSLHGNNDPDSVVATSFKLSQSYPYLLYTTQTTESLTSQLADFDAAVIAGRNTFLAAGLTEAELINYDDLAASYRSSLLSAVSTYLPIVQSLYASADEYDLDSFDDTAFESAADILDSANGDYSDFSWEIALLNNAAGL